MAGPQLPTLAKSAPEPEIVVIPPVIETVETVAEIPDDIIYVTITIPVSKSPRGRKPPRCDLKLERNRAYQSVVRQIFDGCDVMQTTLRNGVAISTPPKAVLKLLELVDDAIRKAAL